MRFSVVMHKKRRFGCMDTKTVHRAEIFGIFWQIPFCAIQKLRAFFVHFFKFWECTQNRKVSISCPMLLFITNVLLYFTLFIWQRLSLHYLQLTQFMVTFLCHIYLLKWYDKLVISDIDGTITNSDVLGHVIPAIGGTWAHYGVAELYTGIKKNGYQTVYLSSRAIGQSHYTKTYLQNFAQGSRTLPDGPILLSPSSVLMAFRKEVIERKPEEFKIACLTDLKSLFPVGQPFFAGFGNRKTDVKSYLAVQRQGVLRLSAGKERRATNAAGDTLCPYRALYVAKRKAIFHRLEHNHEQKKL